MPYSAFPISKYDTEAAKVELCMGASGSKGGDPTPLAPAHAEDLTNLQQVHTLGQTSPACSVGLGLLLVAQRSIAGGKQAGCFSMPSADVSVWDNGGARAALGGQQLFVVAFIVMEHLMRQQGMLGYESPISIAAPDRAVRPGVTGARPISNRLSTCTECHLFICSLLPPQVVAGQPEGALRSTRDAKATLAKAVGVGLCAAAVPPFSQS